MLLIPASNRKTPAIPEFCIQTRSFLMPSFVIFPFIQCHQVIGLYSGEGLSNPSARDFLLLQDVMHSRAAAMAAAQMPLKQIPKFFITSKFKKNVSYFVKTFFAAPPIFMFFNLFAAGEAYLAEKTTDMKNLLPSAVFVTAFLPLIAALLPLIAVSCEKSRDEGKGSIEIVFNSDNPFCNPTKAGTATLPDTNDFILSVTDAAGRVVYQGKYGASPETIITDPGNYTVTAVSREFSEPLFDAPQYGDTQVVAVAAGKTVRVVLDCCQQNSGIKLNINPDFLTAYPNGCILLKSTSGKLMYGYSEKRIAYFKPGNVSMILSDGGVDETLFTRNLEPQQILVVNVSCGVSDATKGGISLQVDTCRFWTSENYVIGAGGDSGSDLSNAMSVSQARSAAGASDVWVYGYIVGGDLSSSKCSFSAPFSSRTNIVLASKPNCTDKQACISVQLSQGDIRDAVNLVDHPDNLGRQIFLKGDVVSSYYGIPGLQGLSEYKWK